MDDAMRAQFEEIIAQYLSKVKVGDNNELIRADLPLTAPKVDAEGLRLVHEKIDRLTKDKTLSPQIQERLDCMLSKESMELDLIGFKHNTDKSSLREVKGEVRPSHDYLRHYDSLFDRFRAEPIALVEFGCAGGASLRMWAEYFPKADIYGVDLNESVKKLEQDRIHIVIGDATKPETRDEIMSQLNGKRPFIILDDASHAWSDQRISLEVFWQSLAPGGFYVVEDLQCATNGAYPQYPPAVLDARPFFDYVLDLCSILRWQDRLHKFYQDQWTFKHLPQSVKDIALSLDECHLLPGALALRKRFTPPPTAQPSTPNAQPASSWSISDQA